MDHRLPLIALLAVATAAASAEARPRSRPRPDRGAEELMRRGVRAYQEARLEEAEGVLTRAISIFPGWKTASGYRAIVRRERGKAAAARADAVLAAALRPDGAESYAARGFALLVLGDPREAHKDFTSAAQDEARYVPAHIGMAAARAEAGQPERALAPLNLALDLSPDAAMALLLRGELALSLRDYPAAKEDLDRAIAFNPSEGRAYADRGLVRAEVGDRRGALADLQRAASLAPERREEVQPHINRLLAELGAEEEPPAYAQRRFMPSVSGPPPAEGKISQLGAIVRGAWSGERESSPSPRPLLVARAYDDHRADADMRDAPADPALDRRRRVSRDILRRYGYQTGASGRRSEPPSDLRDSLRGDPELDRRRTLDRRIKSAYGYEEAEEAAAPAEEAPRRRSEERGAYHPPAPDPLASLGRIIRGRVERPDSERYESRPAYERRPSRAERRRHQDAWDQPERPRRRFAGWLRWLGGGSDYDQPLLIR